MPLAKKLDIVPSLDAAKTEAAELLAIMKDDGLSSPRSDYDEVLGHAHEKIQALENAKEFRTRPSKDAYDKEVKPFNEALAVWRKVKDTAKQFIGEHTLAENNAKQLALTTAAEEGDAQALALAAEQGEELNHAAVKGVWTHRVVDEKLVPDKFCQIVRTVNHALIEHAIADGTRKIPGVEIYQKANVRVAGRKKSS